MAIRLMSHQFSAEEYHRMVVAGILGEDDRVELIGGEVVDRAPVGGEHVDCVSRLNRLFSRLVGDQAWVSVRNPIRLGEHSEPQPDIALLARLPTGHQPPTSEDVLLLIEVADTSLVYDLNATASLYARAEIPELWVVSRARGEVIRHTGPRDGAWLRIETLRGEDRLAAERLPVVALTVADVFGTEGRP